MLPHLVEINGNDRYLCKEQGFLCVMNEGKRLGRLPLDDLSMVLVAGYGTVISANLLSALAERCVPVVFCNSSMRPVSISLPLEGHHLQSLRMKQQARAGLPLQKRLWQSIVATKINLQAQLAETLGQKAGHLKELAKAVRSGDSGNCEATAAALYWPLCFGKNFRRDRDEPTVNALLNYAYAILRAATARAIVLSGLHPAFGIFHHNSRNSMPLADDLMEPFRPVADMLVLRLVQGGKTELDPESKQFLAALIHTDMQLRGEVSPAGICLQRLAASLPEVYAGERSSLALPEKLISAQSFEEYRRERA